MVKAWCRGAAILAAGLALVLPQAGSAQNVGFFTDNNASDIGPATPIIKAGFNPIQITDISTFDLNAVQMLMIDEYNNSGLSSAMVNRLPAIRSWVTAGGLLAVNDRYVGPYLTPTPNPFLVGMPGILAVRDLGANIDVTPPGGTLLTNGPFGTIDNTALDNGSSSNHGYLQQATLGGATELLQTGAGPSQAVAISYKLGAGDVFYSAVPLDYYLDGNGAPQPRLAFDNIYAPNMLTYMHSLRPAPAPTPEPGTMAWLASSLLGLGSFTVRRRRGRLA